MALIQVNDLSIGFRGPPLLDHVTCQIEAKQRIGLLGRNGSGKTTFMRILAGQVQPDGGSCTPSPGVKVSILPQDVPHHLTGRVSDVVCHGLPPDERDDSHMWLAEQKVDRILTKMNLDGDQEVSSMSSGMKRRVLLARTIVAEPDVLLLDEPTNHLDIEAIAWLEDFLPRWPSTLLFVTHDRAFLRKLATRILEIDRGRMFDWSCDYETFLVRKEQALAAEEKQNALFDKKLAQEEAWIRQGIKARRTRNEGRVRALKEMRNQRSQRREQVGKAKLEIQTAEKSGALVAKVEGISFAYDNNVIVSDFSTTVMRGDKIGVIGRNGAGKTTLLRLLLGQLEPQSGTVKLGTNLEIAYFDQLRHTLRDDSTVEEEVGEGSDSVTINGRSRHVLGYLQDFLFAPERARTPIRFLSGGERNRVLLAKLFSKPANVIVLDEPTNDLDAETLEMLEDRLMEFEGTILLVSHDREFLDNVVTSTIVFEPGGAREYVGGYSDWVQQRKTESENSKNKASGSLNPSTGTPAPSSSRGGKLSYKEKRELEELPQRIEQFDAQLAELHEAMADPEFFKQPSEKIATRQAELTRLAQEQAKAYSRWEELETRNA